MKKSISILLLLVMLFSLAACSGGGTTADGDTTAADTTAPIADDKWPAVEGTALYVDASASEGGDGSKDAPFISIPEAQTKIREMKSGEGLPEGGITVLVASGEYSAADAISFTADDSGTKECPIVYKAAEKGGAVISGGITISPDKFVSLTDDEKARLNDETAKDNVKKVDLTEFGITAEDLGEMFSVGADVAAAYKGMAHAMLYIDSEKMPLSRYPNESDDDPCLRTGAGDGSVSFELLTVGEFEAQAMALKERGLNWDTDDIWLSGFLCYGWADSSIPVESFDPESLKVTLEHSPRYGGIKLVKAFYFYNVFAETDVPGEYYIDRDSMTLYLYPTENFDDSTIVLSLSDDVLITAKDASYISFDGFTVTATRANGIVLSGDNITVENCHLYGISGNAIDAAGTHITIKNNEIAQIGLHGINIRGGDSGELVMAENLVYNNYIHHWNREGNTGGYAVVIGGCGTTLSHNEMHDAPHQAVAWSGPKHTLEYNKIYNVCLTTDDCGAIYNGRNAYSYGCVIRYNYIYDIGAPGTSSGGIYLDDAVSGQHVYGNFICNVSGRGIQVGGGRDNIIENNLIIDCNMQPIDYDSRSREGVIKGDGDWLTEGTFYRETITLGASYKSYQEKQAWLDAFPTYGDIIPFSAEYTGDIDDPNLSANPANSVVRKNIAYYTSNAKGKTFAISGTVEEMGTVEDNYRIYDLEHVQIPGAEEGDYTLTEECEAYAAGFEKLPFEEMGRVTE